MDKLNPRWGPNQPADIPPAFNHKKHHIFKWPVTQIFYNFPSFSMTIKSYVLSKISAFSSKKHQCLILPNLYIIYDFATQVGYDRIFLGWPIAKPTIIT